MLPLHNLPLYPVLIHLYAARRIALVQHCPAISSPSGRIPPKSNYAPRLGCSEVAEPFGSAKIECWFQKGPALSRLGALERLCRF